MDEGYISKPKSNSVIEVIESGLEFFFKNTIFSLVVIGVIAFLIRLHYFTPELPLTQDALRYFWYANDLNVLDQFPKGHDIANNGWPAFLSLFFSIFSFSSVWNYMFLQKILSISLSVLTIIPIYFLVSKFFKKPYALFGAALFAFEPRIIQNSLLGITEPLYILLGSIAIFLFLSDKKTWIYISFGIVALGSLVRLEGLFLFLAFSILYVVRFRKQSKDLLKYPLVLGIFVIVLIPMALVRIETTGDDALGSRVFRSADYVLESNPIRSERYGTGPFAYIATGIENLTKFLGWAMIPTLIWFAPIGFVLIFMQRNFLNTTILVILFIMLIPAVYAFAAFSDTRYLFFLYPLFCVFAGFTVKSFVKRFSKPNTSIVLLIGGVLLTSFLFLELKKVDVEYEMEALSFADQVIEKASVVNQYLPESKYIVITEIKRLDKFPILSTDLPDKSSKTIPIRGESIDEFIKYGRERGLTHIVSDGIEKEPYKPSFLSDVFYHEEKYPYLIKVYDSAEHNFIKYHAKIFEIDYNKLE